MELQDPSIISAVVSENNLSAVPSATNEKNGNVETFDSLDKFLKDVRAHNEELNDKSSSTTPVLEFIPSITDYKPDISNSAKVYVYSINELLEYSKNVPSSLLEEKTTSLPKKKFWRLYHRHPEHAGHKANYRNQSNNNNFTNKSKSFGNEPGHASYERRNSKSKNKHSKRSYKQEEKSSEKNVEALNSDAMLFDSNFVPSGNSMADFEAWKAKMKELDQQKNTPKESTKTQVTDSPYPQNPVTSGSSSIISDFLKLSKPNAAGLNGDLLNQSTASDRDDKIQSTHSEDKPVALESSRSSSSRFTSFFGGPSSSSSNTMSSRVEMNSKTVSQHGSETTQTTLLPTETPQERTLGGGSRLMTFFKDSSVSSTPKSEPSRVNTPQLNVAKPQQMPHLQPQQPQPQHGGNPMMSQQQMMMQGMPPINNNVFFQELLNKNKNGENERGDVATPPLPPPGMIARGIPQNFPPNMHPGMLHPGMIPPPGLQGYSQPRGENKNNEMKDNQKNQKDGKSQQVNQPQFMPMMPPPGFMPPPGMQFPPNGMMMPPLQMNNQGKGNLNHGSSQINQGQGQNIQRFFPPMPPHQSMMPPQQHNSRTVVQNLPENRNEQQ